MEAFLTETAASRTKEMTSVSLWMVWLVSFFHALERACVFSINPVGKIAFGHSGQDAPHIRYNSFHRFNKAIEAL